MELQDINNFVKTANEDQLKASGFSDSGWHNILKYCICTSNCSQNCELVKTLGGTL